MPSCSSSAQAETAPALTTDTLAPPGIYVGTHSDDILESRDAGDHGALLLNWLPPVYALAAAVIYR
jgi:hypothetical protein